MVTMNKKKRMIGILVFVALLVIAIAMTWIINYRKKQEDNRNIRYFDAAESVDDIEWLGVAEDGVSTCIVEYGDAPYYYRIIPGKYIILESIKGTGEIVYGGLGENIEFERFELYRYNIRTGESYLFFDGVEYLKQYPDMQLIMDVSCTVLDGENVYQQRYEQRPQENEIERDSYYLCINVEDGSCSVQAEKVDTWNTYTTTIFKWIEDDRLLRNNLPEKMVEFLTGTSGYIRYAEPYQNFEGVFSVRGLAEYLPENNEVLYGMFPELEQYRGEENCYVHLLIGGNPTDEELLRLFMEDGQEISFEGAVLEELWSIDGKAHEIHSFEEYEQWRNW